MTCSHLSQARQTDINTKSSETPRPIPDLWLVQLRQYWPLIGRHWPQSDPCHCYWYQGPVSLHNGGCIVTSEARHLIIIGDQINTYSEHWRLRGSLSIRGDGIQIRTLQRLHYIALLALFVFVLRKARRQQAWMSRVGRAACLDLWLLKEMAREMILQIITARGSGGHWSLVPVAGWELLLRSRPIHSPKTVV